MKTGDRDKSDLIIWLDIKTRSQGRAGSVTIREPGENRPFQAATVMSAWFCNLLVLTTGYIHLLPVKICFHIPEDQSIRGRLVYLILHAPERYFSRPDRDRVPSDTCINDEAMHLTICHKKLCAVISSHTPDSRTISQQHRLSFSVFPGSIRAKQVKS